MTIAFCGHLLLPSRYSTLSASGCCHEALSLHLRYGLDIALSTLNSCRLLHKFKTRFPVRRLFLFPGLEFHQLKVPGLSWRTEEPTYVKAGYLGVYGPGDSVKIQADGNKPLRLLFASAQKLNEPVVRGGPFVMNTMGELKQAFYDYQTGNLG